MSIIQPSSDHVYQEFLQAITSQVVQSRIGAARAVNRSLIGRKDSGGYAAKGVSSSAEV